MKTVTLKSRRAFTLVELLTVIAIIAVLAAILLPVFAGVQRRAREAACKANMSEIGVQLRQYKQDYKAYPMGTAGPNQVGLADPQGDVPGAPGYDTFDRATGRKSRLGALYPNYVREQARFICPEEDGASELLSPRTDPDVPVAYNGVDDEVALSVNNDPEFTSSTYDDYYNYFGYTAGGGNGPGLAPAPPSPRTRNDKMLANLYAPDSTIVTICREHEERDKQLALILRLSTSGNKTETNTYNWVTQPELANN
ncbi:MAG TPA: hypothetical protein DCZ72_13825 [Armatimonadetes bacterium]|nr:hypothetical protein [Armatimonadota bacterium]